MPNFAGSGSELSGPTPVLAAIDVVANTWGVVFNQPLRTSVLTATNWILRTADTAWPAATATALELHVGGTLAPPSFGEFTPGANYAAAPPDVLSAAGVAAPSFAAFPLT